TVTSASPLLAPSTLPPGVTDATAGLEDANAAFEVRSSDRSFVAPAGSHTVTRSCACSKLRSNTTLAGEILKSPAKPLSQSRSKPAATVLRRFKRINVVLQDRIVGRPSRPSEVGSCNRRS